MTEELQFRQISLEENYARVREVRARMTELHGFEPTESMIEPWLDCSYWGLFAGTVLVGVADFFRYDEKYGSYAGNVFSDHYPLAEFCSPDKMGHVRTLYLEPDYQRKYKYFLYFYLSGVRAMAAHNCDYFTMTTTRKDYLLSLYRKLGFKELCSMSKYPGQKPGHLILLLGDIRRTLHNNPLLEKWKI